ncbi:hypothetical protein Hypma_007802 [Hypsizygus marmoreus]|uniref:Uncharacterized protein n=1 Tax=Hypsizygus marmoreus TaxID=39966 RepID=A0A369K3N0_HYPMA|nr:hypothetical protein Hypma_007802 [Hypsizygus marmoreus]
MASAVIHLEMRGDPRTTTIFLSGANSYMSMLKEIFSILQASTHSPASSTSATTISPTLLSLIPPDIENLSTPFTPLHAAAVASTTSLWSMASGNTFPGQPVRHFLTDDTLNLGVLDIPEVEMEDAQHPGDLLLLNDPQRPLGNLTLSDLLQFAKEAKTREARLEVLKTFFLKASELRVKWPSLYLVIRYARSIVLHSSLHPSLVALEPRPRLFPRHRELAATAVHALQYVYQRHNSMVAHQDQIPPLDGESLTTLIFLSMTSAIHLWNSYYTFILVYVEKMVMQGLWNDFLVVMDSRYRPPPGSRKVPTIEEAYRTTKILLYMFERIAKNGPTELFVVLWYYRFLRVTVLQFFYNAPYSAWRRMEELKNWDPSLWQALGKEEVGKYFEEDLPDSLLMQSLNAHRMACKTLSHVLRNLVGEGRGHELYNHSLTAKMGERFPLDHRTEYPSQIKATFGDVRNQASLHAFTKNFTKAQPGDGFQFQLIQDLAKTMMQESPEDSDILRDVFGDANTDISMEGEL